MSIPFVQSRQLAEFLAASETLHCNARKVVMDFITSAIISNAAYDIVKHGFLITADKVKEGLGRWVNEDVVAEQVALQLAKLEITDEHSPVAIERRIDKSPEFGQLIQQINAHIATVAPSAITTVNQTHSGSGDNVAGSKISY